jgi:EthD domain
MTDVELATVELFLAGRDNSQQPDEITRWSLAARNTVNAADARAVVHDSGVLGGLAHGDETADSPTFLSLLQIRNVPGREVPELIQRLLTPLAQCEWVDRDRSTVVVGPEIVVVPGEQPLLLAMALRRKEPLTRSEFQRYWSTKHAELGRRVPGSQGYRQVHTDAALTNEARRVLAVNGPDYDGVAVACYADQHAFLGIMANAEVVGRLLDDERKFINHSASAMVVGYEADERQTPT